MTADEEILSFPDREAWRSWLEAHHDERAFAWVAHWKVGAASRGLRYEEGVEEALCFGWIDGLVHALDDDRFLQRYSPRKPGSVWSESNKRRVERLIAAGRMTEAGLARVRDAQANGQWDAATRRENVELLPDDLRAALGRRDALSGYLRLAPSRRKQLAHWIESARRAETRERRIAAVVEEAVASAHDGPADEVGGPHETQTDVEPGSAEETPAT